jgi:hypothetical protein
VPQLELELKELELKELELKELELKEPALEAARLRDRRPGRRPWEAERFERARGKTTRRGQQENRSRERWMRRGASRFFFGGRTKRSVQEKSSPSQLGKAQKRKGKERGRGVRLTRAGEKEYG